MFCGHCGNQIEDRAEFCGNCGGRIEPEPEQEQEQEQKPYDYPHADETNRTAKTPGARIRRQAAPKKSSKSKIFAIAACIALLAVVVTGVIWLLNRNQDEQPIEQILELAEEALDESDYEQAITYFRVVIEREPFEPRGYTGAAEAYIGLDEPEQAEEILRQGLEVLPDNPQINTMLQEVEIIIRQHPQDSPQAPPSDEPHAAPPDGGDISQPQPGSNELLSALQAFYEELNGVIERHGITDGSEAGVILAKLVDFENDGIPELVYTLFDPHYVDHYGTFHVLFEFVICRYYNRSITQFTLEPNGWFPTHALIATDSDDISYFMFGLMWGEGFTISEEWYAIRDSQFVNVLTLRNEHLTIVHGELWRDEFFFNDELAKVIETEYGWAYAAEAREEFFATARSELDIVYEYSLHIQRWGDPFGGSVLPLLDELRARIEALVG